MRETYKINYAETKEVTSLPHRRVTLHRVVSLPGNKFCRPYVRGGWIEDESNLEDGAWVADNAVVLGGARVYDGALIKGSALIESTAKVHGGAVVSGQAVVNGRAEVFGNTVITDSARVYGDVRLHGTKDSPIILGSVCRMHSGDWDHIHFWEGDPWNTNISGVRDLCIGCQDHPLEKWRKHLSAIARRVFRDPEAQGEIARLTEEQIKRYLDYYNEACDICGAPELKYSHALVLAACNAELSLVAAKMSSEGE